MSKSKFNLKDYEKTNGDEHITMRLQKEHGKESDVVNQKQLEDYRVNEDKNVVVEKLLENKRLGSADEITEKRLDKEKALFENKYRNEETHKGDINKLEEKRLKGETMESEKYEAASSTPKQFRWWEVKSPDGLKVANKTVKTAQSEDEDKDIVEELIGTPDSGEPTEEEAEQLVTTEPYVDPTDVDDDFIIDDDTGSLAPAEGMFVLKQKDLENPNVPGANGIYMVLAYSPEQYGGDENRIKAAAYEKVVSVRPELADVISPDDFSDIQESSTGGIIKLRAYGEEIYDFFQNKKMGLPPEEIATGKMGEGESGGTFFKEIDFKQKDLDGTPMVFGRVVTDEPITEVNREAILSKAIDFISQKHPEVIVDVDSLDLSKIDVGEIGFMVSAPEPGHETATPEELAQMEDIPAELEPEPEEDFGEEDTPSGLENPEIRRDLGEDDRSVDEVRQELDKKLVPAGVKKQQIKSQGAKNLDDFDIKEITAQSNTKKK